MSKSLEIIRSPPLLKCSEWADKFRFLSAESSAAPGKWNTDRAPYQREILDAATDPKIPEVIIQTSSQVGKTEIILNAVGYYMDQDPCPIMILQPTLEMAEAFSKDRLAPMIRDTPNLRKKIGTGKSRDGNSTILYKKFPGGHATLAGSNSPASLASRPIRALLCDETDRYGESAGKEGDPIKLARKRTTTFYNKKIIEVSTPTIKGKSRIAKSYELSDQREYHVPCPDCSKKQVLMWENVKWDKESNDPNTAMIYCIHCGVGIKESKKMWMLRNGIWIAKKNFKGIAGFYINELYSPWKKVKEVVSDFIQAEKLGPEAMKVFVNTSLGIEYEYKEGEEMDWKALYKRRDQYEFKSVPKGGLILTCGVDVQKERLEIEVVAWGRNKVTWSVDYHVITGDTSKDETWNMLDEYIATPFRHESGNDMYIEKVGIDTGYNTQEVYRWCRRHSIRRVFALKGSDDQSIPVAQPKPVDVKFKGKAKKIAKGLLLYRVGVNILKTELFGWLKLNLDDPNNIPHGYCFFPEYDEEYFMMLTSEEVVATTVKGTRKYIWQKTRDRNEALDCRIYNRAVSIIHGIDRFNENDWRKLELDLTNSTPLKPKETDPKRKSTNKKVKKDNNEDYELDLGSIDLNFEE